MRIIVEKYFITSVNPIPSYWNDDTLTFENRFDGTAYSSLDKLYATTKIPLGVAFKIVSICVFKELNVGDKVNYKVRKNHPDEMSENGMVKSIEGNDIRVVYNCNNDWENFEEYTGQLTELSFLRYGWSKLAKNYKDSDEELINNSSKI